jgi:hypothetical protein
MNQAGIFAQFNWWRLVVSILLIAMPSSAKWLTIHNDFNQFDSDGNSIRTRSGCLCKFGDTYYWYGCDQGMTNQTCYSSFDLLHWKNHGNMLTATRGTNRMDVLYNDSTKKYVMVLKWETEGTPNWCTRGIATSNSPTGPFTKLYDSLVYGIYTGDMSVFKDDDGKAYYLYELWDNNKVNNKTSLGFSLMTADYIGLEKKMQQWSNTDREASMMMKRRGMYYYLTSGMMGIDPTETQYFTAHSINGTWTTNLVPVIAPGDADRKSWDTQCDYVYPFKGKEDTVQMYCGDRWKRPHAARGGDYVWLPLSFTQKDSVVLNYYQDWEVDPERGVWRTIDDKRNLALNKTATASSVSGSNVANNVTNPSTYQNYLNTKWVSATSDPQWITIDLGSLMSVNRVILKWDSAYAKSFKIQVSSDNSEWTDVFSTTKAGARSVTDEIFATTTARYVRMYGTERGNTDSGYSLFDFMVLNDSLPVVPVMKSGHSVMTKGLSMAFVNNTVSYFIPIGSSVMLDVVDACGKVVAVLDNGSRIAGNHTVAIPVSLSRGLYIIRLNTGTTNVAMKLIRG